MIKTIIAYSLTFFLFIAIGLSLNGITQVSLSRDFLSFLVTCNNELNSFKIAIPNIPNIPSLQDSSGLWVIIEVLINFVNGLVSVLNIIIMVLNAIISVVQFSIIIIKNSISLVSGATESTFGSSEVVSEVISSV